MKKYLTSAVLIACLAGSAAYADTVDQKLCRTIGTVAAKTMEARQVGVPMSDMMDALTKNAPDANQESFVRDMVIAAYDSPAYNSEDVKQKAINDFRTKYEVICYKSQQGTK